MPHDPKPAPETAALPIAARAPPLDRKRLPRWVWISGAVGIAFLSILLCAGLGIGVSIIADVGPAARLMQPVVVGKWEPVDLTACPGAFAEFRQDGTGTLENKDQRNTFKWRIENGSSPVLVIDVERAMGLPDLMGPFRRMGSRSHSNFKRDGDTLTITSLQAPAIPMLVLRRLK